MKRIAPGLDTFLATPPQATSFPLCNFCRTPQGALRYDPQAEKLLKKGGLDAWSE
jgi:hypothetical protein